MSYTPVSREKRDKDSPGVTSPLSKQSKIADDSSNRPQDKDRLD